MDGYPVGGMDDDELATLRDRIDAGMGIQWMTSWDFGLGIEVERILRDEDCGELSPESRMPCLLAPDHKGRAHVAAHPSGNPGWTVSWA